MKQFLLKLYRRVLKAVYLLLAISFAVTAILAFSFFVSNVIYLIMSKSEFCWENVFTRMYFDKTSFISLYSSIIAMTSLSGPAIAFYWSMRQNERSQINLSYDFLKEWREGTVPEAMYIIHAHFSSGNEEELKKSLYSLLEDAKVDPSKDGLAKAVRNLLNYFESIATACHQGHVDVVVIRRYFESVIIKYYKLLITYIIDARLASGIPQDEVHNDKIGYYSDFTSLAKRWMR